MDIAELARPGGAELGPVIWALAGMLAITVGVLISYARLSARMNVLKADNQDLRHAFHELRESTSTVAEQLDYNQRVQRGHLGQIADYLESGQVPDYAALRSADTAMPASMLPDIDLHEQDDYQGEPLINTDPSRIVVAGVPEPDLLSQIRPLASDVGEVADESFTDATRVANEWHVQDSPARRQA